jgi:Skp family chaperone for outer membrane proteins
MDLDKDDLAILCRDLTKEEVDRVHRLIHEWGIGPEDSFPAQLSLLTRAQFKAAASIPRAIADSRKWLELHLAEYRKQTAALTDDFAGMVDIKHGELKDIVLKHAETVKRDALFVSNRLVDANDVAKSIQKNLQSAAAEWNQSQDALARERQRFEKVCQKLDDAINLRGVHWYIIGMLTACVVTLLIGHYVWHH